MSRRGNLLRGVRRSAGRRPALAAPWLTAFVFAATFLPDLPARGQCTIGSPPAIFDQPGLTIPGNNSGIGGPEDNSMALYKSPSGYRIVTRYDYGYAVFDASHPQPEHPTLLNGFDIHSSNWPHFALVGDGQFTVNAVGAADDGSRILVSYNSSGHGTLLMPGDGDLGDFASFGGDFLPTYCRTCGGGPVVDMVPRFQAAGYRYIGYAASPYGIYVADVTTPLPFREAIEAGKIKSEVIASAPTGPGTKVPSLAVSADGSKRYLVYGTGISGSDPISHVVVVDVSNPGAVVPGITANFQTTVFNASDFGLPNAIIYAVGAAIHPQTQKLQILVEGANASGGGVVLGTFTPGPTPALTLSPLFAERAVGTWTPDTSSATVAMLLPTTYDLLGFVWKQGTNGASKLFSFSSNKWGTDLSPSVIIDPATTSHWATPQVMRAFTSGTAVYAYMGTPTSTGSYAQAMRLDCDLCAGTATPVVTLSTGANPSCSGESVTLDAGAGFTTYRWSTGETSQSIAVSPAGTTRYTVTGTVDGCTSPAGEWLQTVHSTPAAPTPTNDGPKCQGGSIQLAADHVAGATYLWTGPSGFTSSARQPTLDNIVPSMAGDYLLTLTVDGCSSAAGKTTVVVNPAPPTPVVTAPDAVPPNGSFTASIPQVPNADHVWTVTNGTVTSGQHTDQVGILANGAGLLSISVTSSDSTTHCQAAPGTTTIRVGAAAATSFRTILPCRLFDTRNGSGADSGAPILAAGETRTMAIGSRCSVPAGSIVLSVNQTVTGQTAAGDLVLFRGDRGAAPGASSIAFRPGVTRASNGMLELALDGSRTFKVFNNSAGSVHLILDVNGYFQ